MKIQVLSDLHNEFYRDGVVPQISDTDSEIIVLAGDIDIGVKGVTWAVEESARLEKPIIYISGNHEYYNTEFHTNLEEMRRAATNNVHFLENNSALINGVRFLGCTMWTDFAATGEPELAMLVASSTFTDYHCIRLKNRMWDGIIRPEDTLQFHQKSVEWLSAELEKEYDGITVVVTHFAPSPLCQHPGYPLDARSAFFLSNLESLVEKTDLWLFGHSHHCFDNVICGTPVVANQRGYPSESVANYNPAYVVEV